MYREAIPRTEKAEIVRGVASADSFRGLKVVVGAVLLAGVSYAVWTGTWSSLDCAGSTCAVVQDSMLRPTQRFPFDPRNPPQVLTTPGSGRAPRERLIFRYTTGDVQLESGSKAEMVALADRVRAYFQKPEGTLHLGKGPTIGPYLLVVGLSLFGLVMTLDGLNLAVRHRLRLRAGAKFIDYEWRIVGITVLRRSFELIPTTRLISVPAQPNNPRVTIHWLALQDGEEAPRQSPLFDRMETRPIVEEMLAHAQS